ncbi:phage tail protein [Salmonella enterica subsp. enterica serovar Newport]|nr:phage tail protein [Salmonella enterica subsp. enterica serovar Newport]
MSTGYRVPASPVLRPPVSTSTGTLLTRQGPVAVVPPVSLLPAGRATRPSRIVSPSHHPGYTADAWLSHFYNRIALLPSSVSLGAISSVQTIRVRVWNAWLIPQTLLEVTVSGGEGISITGPHAPQRFNRLALHEWEVTVSPEGPDIIACGITWRFSGLPPVTCTLTGSRTVSWQVSPDWSEGMTEVLEWKTDVHRSQTGAEQRVARRLSPRRTFEFRVIAEGMARRRLEQQLFSYGSRTWALPVYPDVTLCTGPVSAGSFTVEADTSGRDFVPGRMALICAADPLSDDRESVEVSTVEAGRLTLSRAVNREWPAGSRVFPLRSARLTEPAKITRRTDGVITAQVRFLFTEHNDWPDAPGLTYYRGHPVLEPGSDWSDDLTAEYTRLTTTLDNDTGRPYYQDMAQRPFTVQSHAWLQAGRTEQSQLRTLLYYLRGRQRPVWVGSQATDLVPVSGITGALLDVMYSGFYEDGPAPGRQDLRIETVDKVYYVRVTQVVMRDDHTERLALDTPLDIAQGDIRKISWLSLCVLSSDSVSWEHKTDADGVASLTVTFQGVRDELE